MPKSYVLFFRTLLPPKEQCRKSTTVITMTYIKNTQILRRRIEQINIQTNIDQTYGIFMVLLARKWTMSNAKRIVMNRKMADDKRVSTLLSHLIGSAKRVRA